MSKTDRVNDYISFKDARRIKSRLLGLCRDHGIKPFDQIYEAFSSVLGSIKGINIVNYLSRGVYLSDEKVLRFVSVSTRDDLSDKFNVYVDNRSSSY
ncbi:MAG: hypothetical protein AABX10_04295 [Nanoarchaeota archaeon]